MNEPGNDDDIPARLREALTSPDQVGSPNYEVRLELAEATRRLILESVSTVAGADAIGEATRLVAAASELLAGGPHGREYESAESAITGDPHTSVFVSPLVGSLNPLAPPLLVDLADDVIVASGVFGDQYEGPPGHVHGGIIAAVFDEVLGFAQSLTGRPGMTGRLTVHYRSPTPLHRELRIEGRVDHVEGRKIFTAGRLFHDQTLCAEAEGLFISIDPERFVEMAERRGH